MVKFISVRLYIFLHFTYLCFKNVQCDYSNEGHLQTDHGNLKSFKIVTLCTNQNDHKSVAFVQCDYMDNLLENCC